MRFATPTDDLVIEFDLSPEHPPSFGYVQLTINGVHIADPADLTGLSVFVSTLASSSTPMNDEWDPDRVEIDTIARAAFSDDDVESQMLLYLGEAFDRSFVRRYALRDGRQVFLFSAAGSNSLHLATFELDEYTKVTAAALTAYEALLADDNLA